MYMIHVFSLGGLHSYLSSVILLMYLWLINFVIIYVDKYLSSQITMLINTYAGLILLFNNFIRW